MFLAYRTIGYVTDHNPPLLARLGNSNFIYTSIGRSWQVYNCANMRLKNTSPEKDGQISAMAMFSNQIFTTAIGSQILIWRRTQEVCRITPPEGNRIIKLLAVGDLLLSLSHDGHLYTWDLSDLQREFARVETQEALQVSTDPNKARGKLKTDRLFSETTALPDIKFSTHLYLPPPPSPDDQGADLSIKNSISQKKEIVSTVNDSLANPVVTSWCHPNTYSNKMLIGWSNGVLELWNVRTGKMIYRFNSINELDIAKAQKQKSTNSQSEQQMVNMMKNKAVNCIENAPAIDCVALGRANGDIILLNIKLDKIIHVYTQTDGGVTALTFRSDDANQHLLSGSTSGMLTLWDLKNKESIWSRGGVHGGGVTAAFFLAREPILITAGRDNAIIQWHFEGTQMNMLRTQQGHWRPPSDIKWYSFNEIITGSGDGTLRYWSPTRDRAAQTLSWKSIPNNAHRTKRGEQYGFLTNQQRVIRGIDLTPIYHPDKPSCVTLNSSDTDKVTLWSIENHRAEKLIGNGASAATNTCFSYCGQFVYIGYRNGELKKFNIQSCALRAVLTPDKALSTSHGDAAINKATMSEGKKARIEKKAIKSGQLIDKSNSFGVNPHQHGIAGMFCAVGNDYFISIGRDGIIYTWDCQQDAMIKKLTLPKQGTNVTNVHYAAEYSLLAVLTAENDIYLIDCDRLCVIRQWLNTTEDGYSTQRGRLIQVLLHPHLGLMFISDSLGGIKTYDLNTGIAIDYTLFSKPILSFDVCTPSRDVRSSGDMLVTTHLGCIGIYIWIINPNRYVNTALLASTASIMNSQHNNNNTALVTGKVELSQGNVTRAIDQQTLDKEKIKFEKRQQKLLTEFHKAQAGDDADFIDLATTDLSAEIDAAENIEVGKNNNDTMNDNDNSDDDSDSEGEELDIKHHISGKLNKYERKIYRKLCKSNHFTTVNVLRNISMFDQFITQPNIQVSGKDLVALTQQATQQHLAGRDVLNNNNKNKTNNNQDDDKKENGNNTADATTPQDEEALKKLKNMMIIQKILFKQLNNEMNQKLTMLSGVAASRWKLLTQEQAIAQRNERIKAQQLKAAQDVPFFLNITTGQTKTASKTVYNIDTAMTFQEQQRAILSAKNTEFDLFGAAGQDGQDLLTLCKTITTTNNIVEYIHPIGEGATVNADDDDDEFDDILVSVNDKKKKQEEEDAKKKKNNKKGNKDTETTTEPPKLTAKQQKKLEAEKLKQKQEKQRIKDEKIFDMCMLIRYIYLHQLPLSPPQHYITSYLHQYPDHEGATDLKDRILTQYHQHIKQLYHSFKINHHVDKRALTPIITYFLSTPPSLLSAQIALIETEEDAFTVLHVLYLITLSSLHASGGMIDAVNALLQHVMQQHQVLIAASPLCRTVAALLVGALKKQWKALESLFHSNLAVINHLTGVHQGF